MKRLLWRLEAALAWVILAVLRALGPVRASNLAGLVARLVGPLLPVSRVADTNLRLALPELDAAARRRVVRGVWDNLGRVMGELPHLADLGPTASGPGWEIIGDDVLRVVAHGGPAIFVSGHIGNWEVLPRVLTTYGIDVASLYRPPDNPFIAAMLRDLRRDGTGQRAALFPKGAAGGRAALMHLAKGGYLGLLIDQKLNDGIAVSFFGRRAMTAPALAMLALRYRCPVIPGHVQRLGPARFRLVVDPPLSLPEPGDDRTADVAALTLAVNQTLERWIRARPEAWLWLHRRWPKG
jgi:KDO2-lipid IV(A) lauroyltransferase